MNIDVARFERGALVELRVSDALFSRARVPLESLPQAERAWLGKLAAAAQAGDARSTALLLEAVQGALILDDDATGLRKDRRGDAPT